MTPRSMARPIFGGLAEGEIKSFRRDSFPVALACLLVIAAGVAPAAAQEKAAAIDEQIKSFLAAFINLSPSS